MNLGFNVSDILGSPAGIGRYTNNLVTNLLKLDKDNNYFLFSQKRLSERLRYKFLVYKNCHLIESNSPITQLWLQSVIPYLLKKYQIDIFHSSNSTNFIGNVKRVVTVHDVICKRYPQYFTKKTILNLQVAFSIVRKKAHHVIADSETTKNDIIKFLEIPESKIKVIYLGVDDNFRIIEDEDLLHTIGKKYALTKKFILSIGTLEPRKNVLTILRAFYKTRAKNDYKLILVGKKGWFFKEVFRLINQLKIENEVGYLGYIDDAELPLILNSASLFIYTPFFEGFGLPVLEAMKCGVPVITSNVSSIPEIIGDAGILVNPTDIDELAQKIDLVLENKELHESMKSRGIKQVQRYSWEDTASKTLQLFKFVWQSKRGQ